MSYSFETPWTVAHQAPLCVGFPRQAYRSGLPFPSPRDLPDTGIEHASPALQEDSLLLSHQGSPILGKRDAVMNKRDKNPYLHGVYYLVSSGNPKMK